MHKEVLNNRQIELLPVMEAFKREYYLVFIFGKKQTIGYCFGTHLKKLNPPA